MRLRNCFLSVLSNDAVICLDYVVTAKHMNKHGAPLELY